MSVLQAVIEPQGNLVSIFGWVKATVQVVDSIRGFYEPDSNALEDSRGTGRGRCRYFVTMMGTIAIEVVNVMRWTMHLNELIVAFVCVCTMPTLVVFAGECKYSGIEPFRACI